MKTILIASIVAASLTGCGMTTTMNQDFHMSGNAEGIRAFADTLNGVIRTGKETPEQNSEFFAMRNKQEAEVTKREMKKSFLSDLFAPSTASTQQ